MSADLQWMMIRNNSCFLMKRKSVKQFSKVVIFGLCYSVTTCWQLDFHVLTDKQTG